MCSPCVLVRCCVQPLSSSVPPSISSAHLQGPVSPSASQTSPAQTVPAPAHTFRSDPAKPSPKAQKESTLVSQ